MIELSDSNWLFSVMIEDIRAVKLEGDTILLVTIYDNYDLEFSSSENAIIEYKRIISKIQS